MNVTKFTIITIKYFGNFICSDILLLQQQKTSESLFLQSKNVYKKENEMVEIVTQKLF